MACERSERKSNDPSGIDRRERTTWRYELIDASDGVWDVRLNFTGGYTHGEKARKQRQTGGEEEEMAGGKRRAPKTSRSPKRIKLGEKGRRKRRKQERKGRKARGTHLLLVEQREQSVWIIATRSGVHERGEAGSQVFILWVARSPSNQMSSQEVKGTGDSRAAGDEGEKKKKEEDEGEEKGEKKEEEEKSPQERLEEKIQKSVKARRFRFLHHFAGPRDPLGAAIHQVAAKRGLNVEVIAAEKDWGQDLCLDEPYNTHLRWAKEGLIDGYHSGFPCSTFSRLRFRDAPNLPKPVRTRSEPHGKKSNSQAQQAECDRGTVMLARSVPLAEELAKNPTSTIVARPTSMENPPPSDVEDHLSAWGMSEMVGYLRMAGVKVAQFNACAFQANRARGDRHFKPQQFAGTLYSIESLSRDCKCGGAKHRPIIGKKESQESGEYPVELCRAYAYLLMDHFEKMATAEYLEGRLREEEHQRFEIATGDAEATSTRARRNKEGVKLSPTPEAQRGVDEEWTKEEKRRWEESRDKAKEKKSEEEDKEKKRRRKSKEEERKLEEKRAQKRWRSASRRSRSRGEARRGDGKEGEKADLRWRPGEGKYGMLKEEKQNEKRLDQQGFVGGMKNPMEVGRASDAAELGAPHLGSLGEALREQPESVEGGRTIWVGGLQVRSTFGGKMERGATEADRSQRCTSNQTDGQMVLPISDGRKPDRSMVPKRRGPGDGSAPVDQRGSAPWHKRPHQDLQHLPTGFEGGSSTPRRLASCTRLEGGHWQLCFSEGAGGRCQDRN